MRGKWFTARIGVALLGLMVAVAVAACGGGSSDGPGTTPTSSTAYKGHESDVDIQNFCVAYPSVVATRLDDCQTCHRGGDVDDGGGVSSLNPCSY